MRRFAPLLLAATAFAQQPPEDSVAFTVEGRVLDEAGTQPRPDATVQLWDAMAPQRFLAQGETGPDGAFAVAVGRAAAAGREHRFGQVVVDVRGEGLAQRRRFAPAGARGVELRVPPAEILHGRLIDAEGAPVPGAVIEADDSPRMAMARAELVAREATTTDEQGRFRLTRFADRNLSVVVSHDIVHGVSTGAPERGEWVLQMPPIVRVRGRLLEAGTWAPVAGAYLRADVAGLGYADLAVSGEDGRFEISLPRWTETGRAELDVDVHAPGYRIATIALKPDQDGRGHTLSPAHPITGRVVGADDEPLEGVCVQLRPPPVTASTGKGGGYRFEAVPAGMVHARAEAAGYLPTQLVADADGSADRLTLRLLRGARITGRVVRAGAPVAGVRVSVLDDRRAPGGWPWPGEELAVAFSDGEGRFEVRGVPDTAQRVVAWTEGWRSRAVALDAASEGAEIGPLRLELFERLPVEGRLLSDTGDPLLAALTLAVGGERQTVRTDTQGRFRLDAQRMRLCTLEVSAPDHAPQRLQLWPGEPRTHVIPSRFGNLTLIVQAKVAARTPATITIRRREAPRVLRTAREVEARFDGLPPGRYDVTLEAEGYLAAQAEITLRPEAAEPRVTLTPERGGSVRVVARPRAVIVVQTVEGKPAPLAVLELEGRSKQLRGFGPGVYRFVSRAPGELIVVRRIALGPTTPPASLDLRGGDQATLVVTVRNAVGEPLDGAEITLVAEEGFRWTATERTGPDGKVTLTRLFQGRMEVYAERGNRAGAASIEVEPGASLALDLELR